VSGQNILGLSHWEIDWGERLEGEYRFPARYLIKPVTCPRCGTQPAHLNVHDWKNQAFQDIDMHRKRVSIFVRRSRWKCVDCEATFQQPLPDMDEKHYMTKRLVAQIGELAIREPFATVALDLGVDEKTVRQIFGEHVRSLEGKHRFVTPRAMGIDELKLLGRPRCILTNVAENAIYDLLEDRGQELVTRYLSDVPGRDQIELVATDMWRPYRRAVEIALPRAQVVIDRFHVLRMASQALDAVRKNVRETLTPAERRKLARVRPLLLKSASKLDKADRTGLRAWFVMYPRLEAAYTAKEQFYAVYESASRAEAERRLKAWTSALTAETQTDFAPLLTSLLNWHDEILAYFDHRITNAYTEALNGLVKLMNWKGRGYDFQTIRAKTLFSGAHRVSRPRMRRGTGLAGFGEMDIFGVSIARLTAALEKELKAGDPTHESV
jgi:transposase